MTCLPDKGAGANQETCLPHPHPADCMISCRPVVPSRPSSQSVLSSNVDIHCVARLPRPSVSTTLTRLNSPRAKGKDCPLNGGHRALTPRAPSITFQGIQDVVVPFVGRDGCKETVRTNGRTRTKRRWNSVYGEPEFPFILTQSSMK